MAETGAETEISLRLSHSFDAPREKVFEAWTDPSVLKRWWAAQESWDCPLAEVDLRVGGQYKLSMRDPDSGQVHTVSGEYTSIRAPEHLAYTWVWEVEVPGHGGGEATLVTVDFLEDGERTTVVLTHRGFQSEEVRDRHSQGWGGCFANLGRRVFA